MFSYWLFSKYVECIEYILCTLCTVPVLCEVLLLFGMCMIVTSTDPFFSLGKDLLFFMYNGGILKPFYIYIFSQTLTNDFVFLSCMNSINTCVSLVAREMIQIQCTCADVDARSMHSPSVRAKNKHQLQRACSGFEWFILQQDLPIYWHITNATHNALEIYHKYWLDFSDLCIDHRI